MTHSPRRSRSGTVLILVLACLVVVTALIGSATQAALRGRQAARIQKQLRQTELLCEAGVLRAAQQLRKSTRYEGEQWTPRLTTAAQDASRSNSTSDVRADSEATVEIRVTRSDDSDSSSVEVIARLDSHLRNSGPIQRSHRFTFQSSPTPSSENQ